LIALCREQRTIAQQAAQPELHLRHPTATTAPTPLLMALHGNNQNAATALPFWEPLTAEGWTVALPQSAQLESRNGYVWDDLERATAEIRAHAATLRQNPAIDFTRCVIAGFSMGGRQALWSVLQGIIPARGLILLGPWLPQLPEWLPLLPRLAATGTRTYIIIGTADKDCLPGTEALIAALRERGLPCEVERHPDMGHRYPPDFATSRRQALQFIMEE